MGAGAFRSGAPQPTSEEKVEVAAVLGAPEREDALGDGVTKYQELGSFIKKNGGLDHQNKVLT